MHVKKFALFALPVIASFSVLISACSKSSNSSSAGISATVAGKSVSASHTEGVYDATNQYWDIGGASISSKDSVGLDVNVGQPIVLNKAVSSDTNFDASITYIQGTSAVYSAEGGFGTAIVTVTSIDSVNHKIAGTFSGTLYNELGASDSVVVTNGKFNSSYTVQ